MPWEKLRVVWPFLCQNSTGLMWKRGVCNVAQNIQAQNKRQIFKCGCYGSTFTTIVLGIHMYMYMLCTYTYNLWISFKDRACWHDSQRWRAAQLFSSSMETSDWHHQGIVWEQYLLSVSPLDMPPHCLEPCPGSSGPRLNFQKCPSKQWPGLEEERGQKGFVLWIFRNVQYKHVHSWYRYVYLRCTYLQHRLDGVLTCIIMG